MEFGVYLKKLIEKRGYSYRQLAMIADIDHTYISKIVNGKMGPPSPEILKKLWRPLGVSYEDLMKAAGHLPENTKSALKVAEEATPYGDDPAVQKLMNRITTHLRTDPNMSDKEKEMILEDTAEFLKFRLQQRKKKK